MQRRQYGRARREEIYRYSAVVTECEADLAIAVVRGRHSRGDRRHPNRDSRSGLRVKGKCVVMPGEQHRLGEDSERARKRGNLAPNHPSPTDQDHRRAAPRILILRAGGVRRISRQIDIL